MNNFSKYLGLTMLLMGVVFGFIVFVALVILVFKLLSIALFNNRLSDNIFQYCVTITPYLIFFAADYFLFTKIKKAKNISSKVMASLFLLIGSLVCVLSFLLLSANFFGIKNQWLYWFSENTGYSLIIQLLMVFATA